MLATALLFLASSGSSDPLVTQDSGRVAITSTRNLPEGELRDRPIAELLNAGSATPWDDEEYGRRLNPALREVQRRAESGLMSDEDWRTALLTSDVIHTRSTWPVGQPLLVWIHESPWLRNTRITAVAMEPALGEVKADMLSPTGCANCDLPKRARERRLAFAPLPIGTTRVSMEITVEQRDKPGDRYGATGEVRPLWRGRVNIPVRAVPDMDQVVVPVTDDLVAVGIRKSMAGAWNKGLASDLPELRLTVGGDVQKYPKLRGTAVSLTVALVHDGRAVVYSRLLASDCSLRRMWPENLSGRCTIPTDKALAGGNPDTSGWELLVTGTHEDVLGIWEADRWWQGSFSVPLAEVLSKPYDK
jgi:hypothetical protein